MCQGVVTELNIYPVKSLQGISLQQAELTELGLKWDRFWMIVNQDGQFASQRHLAKMAQITTELSDTSLILSHPDVEPLLIPLHYQGSNILSEAKIWKSECQVLDEGEQASNWLTQVLGTWRGQKLSLVRMAQDFSRAVSTKHTDGANNSTYFADGYPYLICNTASLHALNHELEAQNEGAVPMSRFRSNIVVQTDLAFIEHQARYLEFTAEHHNKLHLCKPCERCKVTAIDQKSGEVASAKQPLKTLLAMKNVEKKGAFFGQNAVISESSKNNGNCTISLGDLVEFNS